jgi:hypothetical protein
MVYWLKDHVNSRQVAYEDGNAPLTVIVPDGSAALFKLRWCTASTQRPMGKTKTYQLPLTWEEVCAIQRALELGYAAADDGPERLQLEEMLEVIARQHDAEVR